MIFISEYRGYRTLSEIRKKAFCVIRFQYADSVAPFAVRLYFMSVNILLRADDRNLPCRMFVKYAYFQYLCIWNMKMNRNHILQLVTEGEHVHQDFKFAITDACKIARSLSAFSNTEGGRLLVGIKDNGKIAAYVRPRRYTW